MVCRWFHDINMRHPCCRFGYITVGCGRSDSISIPFSCFVFVLVFLTVVQAMVHATATNVEIVGYCRNVSTWSASWRVNTHSGYTTNWGSFRQWASAKAWDWHHRHMTRGVIKILVILFLFLLLSKYFASRQSCLCCSNLHQQSNWRIQPALRIQWSGCSFVIIAK